MSITDELREFASLCAGGMGGDALRHIADNIDAEHKRNMILAVDCIETLCAKNARLRELLRELWVSCPVHDSDCDVCKHKGGSNGCELYDRMCELGVEV